jgi:hypothetical protein
LPKSKQQSPEWQAAGEAVIMAAEDRGPVTMRHCAALADNSDPAQTLGLPIPVSGTAASVQFRSFAAKIESPFARNLL